MLPYLNAVAIALQRLAEKIVLLLGFEDFDWGGLGKSGGTTSDALSTIYDETENVSDAMGDATKKAKEFQNQLLGFDEVYKLSEPAEDTSSSATGAGLSGPDTAALDAAFKNIAEEYRAAWAAAFKEMEQESTAIVDRIISAFERGDYKGIGRYISTNISDALASINWDSVYQSANNFGTGLAQFLNGLITPDLFGNVGKTIAGFLNTKIYAALSFGQEFSFVNLGESIAAGVNNFFATFDFGGLAETINVWTKGILNTTITAFDNTNWGMIGEQIGTFLAEIDLFEIGFKIAQALWKGVNAGFDLLVGTFKKAPLETVIVSFATMPKLLKAIMANKFVTGFKKLANGIKLVSGTLIGNQTAITALSNQYPKLSKAINVTKDSFRALRTGISNGSVFNGIKSAIENLRNNLTGLQKGAITAVAGFAEFNIVSDVFEGLISGSENLIAGIAKIGVTVAAAGAAMYTALGPAGLAIAAVTGVVAAIKGISDAFEKIEAEEIGNVIKNALSNPGGTSISELAQGVSNAFSEATSGFKELNSASESVTSVNQNIQSVVDEIGQIKKAMDLGVLSVDEGKQKLNDLFAELVDLTGQKMSVLTTYLLGLYGEGGALSHAYKETEYSAQQVTDAIIRTQYATTDAAQAIYEQMKNVDFGSSEWNNLYQQLLDVSSGMDEIEKAAFVFSDDMQKLEGSINWEEILLPDGSINTDKLGQILGDVSARFEEYNTALNEEEENTKLHWHEMLANAATPEDKALFQQLLDDVPKQFNVMRSEAESHITDFANMLQTDFIAKTGDVIEGAQEEWNSKTDWAKFWAGAFGSKTESEYMQDAVNKQKENVQTLSATIQTEFEGLEASGVAWGSDVAENVYSSLFDYENRWGAKSKYVLKENYREILDEATKEGPSIATVRGKEAAEGYAYGISNNLNVVNQAAIAMTNIAMDAIRQTQNSHSPSKVTEGFGKNAVEGYNLGISNNTNSTKINVQRWIDIIRQTMSNSNLSSLSQQNGLNVVSGFNQGINGGASSTYDTINYYTERIKSGFSNISNSFYNIGESAMQGFSNGLSDKQQEIYNKAQTISNNLAKTIKSALSIHSPSRVMFELGDYTMQGFKNGLEHLYQPILSSMHEFSSDLQIAPPPDLQDIYGNYQYADMSYSMSYEGAEDFRNNYQNSNAETNALLRELLAAVREGKVIKVDGKELGRTVQEQDKAYFAMTGKGMFIY